MREPTETEIERATEALRKNNFIFMTEDVKKLAREFAAVADEAREQDRTEIDAVMQDSLWCSWWELKHRRDEKQYEVWQYAGDATGCVATGTTALAACQAALATVKEQPHD